MNDTLIGVLFSVGFIVAFLYLIYWAFTDNTKGIKEILKIFSKWIHGIFPRHIRITTLIIILLISILFKFLNKKNYTNSTEQTVKKNIINKENRMTLPIKDENIKSNSHVISIKENGYSPYDEYFGKGLYSNDTENTIRVTTPKNVDIIFILKNIKNNRVIRNEYINANSTFELTKIPYGTYNFSYFSGNSWSDDLLLNNGEIIGGFTENKNFSKSENQKDNLEFKTGYYGTYTIKLSQVLNGNLNTEASNEDEFFN